MAHGAPRTSAAASAAGSSSASSSSSAKASGGAAPSVALAKADDKQLTDRLTHLRKKPKELDETKDFPLFLEAKNPTHLETLMNLIAEKYKAGKAWLSSEEKNIYSNLLALSDTKKTIKNRKKTFDDMLNELQNYRVRLIGSTNNDEVTIGHTLDNLLAAAGVSRLNTLELFLRSDPTKRTWTATCFAQLRSQPDSKDSDLREHYEQLCLTTKIYLQTFSNSLQNPDSWETLNGLRSKLATAGSPCGLPKGTDFAELIQELHSSVAMAAISLGASDLSQEETINVIPFLSNFKGLANNILSPCYKSHPTLAALFKINGTEAKSTPIADTAVRRSGNDAKSFPQPSALPASNSVSSLSLQDVTGLLNTAVTELKTTVIQPAIIAGTKASTAIAAKNDGAKHVATTAQQQANAAAAHANRSVAAIITKLNSLSEITSAAEKKAQAALEIEEKNNTVTPETKTARLETARAAVAASKTRKEAQAAEAEKEQKQKNAASIKLLAARFPEVYGTPEMSGLLKLEEVEAKEKEKRANELKNMARKQTEKLKALELKTQNLVLVVEKWKKIKTIIEQLKIDAARIAENISSLVHNITQPQQDEKQVAVSIQEQQKKLDKLLGSLQESIAAATAAARTAIALVAPGGASNLITASELKYNQKQPLGSGTFGTVYEGVWEPKQIPIILEKSIPVAIKVLNKRSSIKEYEKEIDAMERLRSKYIVHFYGHTKNPTAIIMELMQCSLANGLTDQKLDENTRRRIAHDVANGVAFLHANSTTHGDLKTLNVLLNAQREAKLSDFGTARYSTGTQAATQYQFAGTYFCMAPESFTNPDGKYTFQCDIYSLGIILWELATSNSVGNVVKEAGINANDPTKIFSYLGSAIHQKNLLNKIPANPPHPFTEIITKCLAHDPKNRPTADEVVKFLSGLLPAPTPMPIAPASTRNSSSNASSSSSSAAPASASSSSSAATTAAPEKSVPATTAKDGITKYLAAIPVATAVAPAVHLVVALGNPITAASSSAAAAKTAPANLQQDDKRDIKQAPNQMRKQFKVYCEIALNCADDTENAVNNLVYCLDKFAKNQMSKEQMLNNIVIHKTNDPNYPLLIAEIRRITAVVHLSAEKVIEQIIQAMRTCNFYKGTIMVEEISAAVAPSIVASLALR